MANPQNTGPSRSPAAPRFNYIRVSQNEIDGALVNLMDAQGVVDPILLRYAAANYATGRNFEIGALNYLRTVSYDKTLADRARYSANPDQDQAAYGQGWWTMHYVLDAITERRRANPSLSRSPRIGAHLADPARLVALHSLYTRWAGEPLEEYLSLGDVDGVEEALVKVVGIGYQGLPEQGRLDSDLYAYRQGASDAYVAVACALYTAPSAQPY